MSQVTSGFRAVLSSARIYHLLQRAMGAHHSRAVLSRDYIRAEAGDRVLDIGCGTADILDHLPEVAYHGFDLNPRYIASAQARYGARGTFRCEDVRAVTESEPGTYDLVLAIGILHHLDDAEAAGLLRLARAALRPGGRLITFDSCYVVGQSRIAKLLIDLDRGRNTRTEPAYRALAEAAFSSVKSAVHHDLLHFPYTHAILECQA
ncbi:MAG TPA: class I SAM-dependent methyltransferase [Holophagaceae bacterium]|nr:class I SAM-dependent methyltransferase [Holophagaceae bacterium]